MFSGCCRQDWFNFRIALAYLATSKARHCLLACCCLYAELRLASMLLLLLLLLSALLLLLQHLLLLLGIQPDEAIRPLGNLLLAHGARLGSWESIRLAVKL
jgi:hypothetical protein